MSEEDVLRDIARILSKPKSLREMVAEFLREASVLLVVFTPLEAFFNTAVSAWWEIAVTVAFALALGWIGMRLEVWRP